MLSLQAMLPWLQMPQSLKGVRTGHKVAQGLGVGLGVVGEGQGSFLEGALGVVPQLPHHARRELLLQHVLHRLHRPPLADEGICGLQCAII